MTHLSRRDALATLAGGLVLPAVARAAGSTLRMWTFLDPASGKDPREKVLKTLIDGFQSANPGTVVSVEPQIWTQMTDKFFAAHQTGTAPDIIWLHHDRVAAAVSLGALADLDALFARAKLWTPADYQDVDGAYWQLAAGDGKHYHIAQSRSMTGMFYRADLFAAAGIDPKSLTTWDRFIAAAQKTMAKDAGGNVLRWGFGQAFTTVAVSPPVVASVLLDLDKRLFDADGRAVWATPAGVKGLTLEVDMVGKYGITPDTALSLNGEDLYDQFAAGRMAMIRAASARVPRLQGMLGADKVGFLPTPSYTEGKFSPTEAAGWPVAVWSGSRQQDLAARFVAHISSKDADRAWVMEGGAVPIRKSTIADNSAFFAQPANRYLVVIADAMGSAAWFPPEENVGGWNEALNRAAQAVVANKVDPKAALEKEQAAFNRANR